MAVPLYLSTSHAQGFQFVYIISNTCYFLVVVVFFFHTSQPHRCELASDCPSEGDMWISKLLRVILIILEASGREQSLYSVMRYKFSFSLSSDTTLDMPPYKQAFKSLS